MNRSTVSSVATFLSGATLTASTSAHTAWDGTSIPATGTDIAMSGGTRTITVHGLRRILRGSSGTTWFDHSLKTTTDIDITGTRAAGTREIQQGVLVIYHNRAHYTATNTFSTSNKVKWGDPNCCYPTTGRITTVFTGTILANAILDFSSTWVS